MKTIHVPKGYSPKIAGVPAQVLEPLDSPDTLAAVPEAIPFVKPRLAVAEGDRVKIGSVLYVDKRNPDVAFCSPAGGTVRRIRYGPRRVIREIVVDREPQEAFEAHPALDEETLGRIDRKELVSLLLKGGLWPLIRALPTRDIAAPSGVPPAVIVSLDNLEPFQPSPGIYLAGRTGLLRFGLAALHRLAENGPVIVAARHAAAQEFSELVTHTIRGRYPADDPGALLYRLKTSAEQNNAWYVSGPDVLLLGHLLKTGRYPLDRIVAVSGSRAPQRIHLRTRLGAPLARLVGDDASGEGIRFIVGGVFTGYPGSADGHLGLYETSVTLIPEGDDAEFLSLFRPGVSKPTYSRLFASRLRSEPLEYDCNRRGGRRACIGCMHCADVCPVDILPQMAYKAVLAEEVEESLEHGLLDCVECGLCSYVCPAKIELTQVLKDAKADYAREKAG